MIDLQRLYWLSGSPCGGKTSSSNALAERFDWAVYHVDEHWDSHKDRANPKDHPSYHATSSVTGDELWLRPLEEQIRTEPTFVQEAFPLILEDVEKLLAEDPRPLIVDASAVPASLEALSIPTNRVFYLIPSEDFQREQYALRPSIKATLAKTTNPELAWSNWMARDAAYARWLEEQVKLSEFRHLRVDGSIPQSETIDMIAKQFLAD